MYSSIPSIPSIIIPVIPSIPTHDDLSSPPTCRTLCFSRGSFLSVSQIFSYEKWSAAGPPQYLLGNPNFKYNPMMWAEYVEDKRMENGPAFLLYVGMGVRCMW